MGDLARDKITDDPWAAPCDAHPLGESHPGPDTEASLAPDTAAEEQAIPAANSEPVPAQHAEAAPADATRCPHCGAAYRAADYLQDAARWYCAACRNDLRGEPEHPVIKPAVAPASPPPAILPDEETPEAAEPRDPQARTCPHCGAAYRITDYLPEAPAWYCEACRQPLPK